MKNLRFLKNTLVKCNKDAYSPLVHLSVVELRCKLQEKLHRVTAPSDIYFSHLFEILR